MGQRRRRAGRPVGIIVRLLGCWHSHLSLPFSDGGESYRTCLSCGARRRFDAGTWKTHGPYYFA